MKRLFTETKTNIIVQFRNGLYYVGLGVGGITALIISQLIGINAMSLAMAGIMILVVGASTVLYVAAMILFERDEGTIYATLISPLTHGEYLIAKISSLVLLASAEAMLMFYGAIAIMYFQDVQIILPNFLILTISLIAICIIFVLMGIILVVRYRNITDFIMPMAGLMLTLSLPIIYFIGLSDSWLWLIFPISSPTMLMLGAFNGLENWQYLYGIGYSTLLIIGLSIWAHKAFVKHIVGE